MSLSLIAITWLDEPRRPHGMPMFTFVDLRERNNVLAQWRVHVRGGSVLFKSPRGYRQGLGAHQWDPKGPRQVIDVPRARVALHWEDDADDERNLDSLAKWSSPAASAAGPAPAPTDEELDRLTKPKGKP